MSAAGHQSAPEKTASTLPKGRSPLAHLLHALNQPLTGLQCSLELALVGTRTLEQYVRTVRDGLQLTGRMRVLVEAIRELADMEPGDQEQREVILVGTLLGETVDDLRPVAEAKEVRIQVQGDAPLPVEGIRRKLEAVAFRFLESAVSLSAAGSVLQLNAHCDGEQASVIVCWKEGQEAPEHSPFSRQELGLLIASAGWQQAGAQWSEQRLQGTHRVTLRLPLVSPSSNRSKSPDWEI